MIKYVLPLLLTTAAFADSPYNPDPCESCYYHKLKEAEPYIKSLDIIEVLDHMHLLVQTAREYPQDLTTFVKLMDVELKKCKMWLFLQHSD